MTRRERGSSMRKGRRGRSSSPRWRRWRRSCRGWRSARGLKGTRLWHLARNTWTRGPNIRSCSLKERRRRALNLTILDLTQEVASSWSALDKSLTNMTRKWRRPWKSKTVEWVSLDWRPSRHLLQETARQHSLYSRQRLLAKKMFGIPITSHLIS